MPPFQLGLLIFFVILIVVVTCYCINNFKLFVIKFALKKPAPKTIPLSLPRCAENDFYCVFLDFQELNIRFYCKVESETEYSGFMWESNGESIPVRVRKEVLKNNKYKLNVEHYYKGLIKEYHKPASFVLLSVIFQSHKWAYNKDKIEQSLFNNKKLVRTDRYKLLEYLLEKTNSNPDYKTDSLSLGMELHSKRWLLHPDRKAHDNHYKFIFESLVQSGDLVKERFSYKLSPKALTTMSEYERDEQKHLDSMHNAKRTHQLTGWIIFLGICNLLVQLFK